MTTEALQAAQEAPDGLDRETLDAIATEATDERVRACARAWVHYHEIAVGLGFTDAVAQRQAAFAWELERTNCS